MDIMTLIDALPVVAKSIQQDALKATKGNKSAGVRARKASLELEKMLKDYRKLSLEATKK